MTVAAPGKTLLAPAETMGKGLDRPQPGRDNEMSRRGRRNAAFGQTRWVSSPQQGCLADPPFLSVQTVSASHRDVQFSIRKRSAIPLIPPHHIQRVSPPDDNRGSVVNSGRRPAPSRYPSSLLIGLPAFLWPVALGRIDSLTGGSHSLAVVGKTRLPFQPSDASLHALYIRMHSSPSCDTVESRNLECMHFAQQKQYLQIRISCVSWSLLEFIHKLRSLS